jgi:hypothetical protein
VSSALGRRTATRPLLEPIGEVSPAEHDTAQYQQHA